MRYHCTTRGNNIHYDKNIFLEKWAPEVTSLLQPTHNTIECVLEQLLYDTEDLEVCEVSIFYLIQCTYYYSLKPIFDRY